MANSNDYGSVDDMLKGYLSDYATHASLGVSSETWAPTTFDTVATPIETESIPMDDQVAEVTMEPISNELSNSEVGYLVGYAEDSQAKNNLIETYTSQEFEADYMVGAKCSSDSKCITMITDQYVAMYGVSPAPWVGGNGIHQPIALYGPAPIVGGNGIYQPIALYGVPGPGVGGPVTISMTEEEIKENVAKLKKAANNMENSWVDIKGPILKSIKESWVSKECTAYVSKIEKMDKKVTNSIEALRLLAKTYEQSIDKLASTRKSIMTAISNI